MRTKNTLEVRALIDELNPAGAPGHDLGIAIERRNKSRIVRDDPQVVIGHTFIMEEALPNIGPC